MGARRVGVVSWDDALLVAVALRDEHLDVHRVAELEDLAGFDVALVEVATASEGTDVVDEIPEGPAVVLLSPEAQAVEGATVVLRPCSIDGLVDVLRTVGSGPSKKLVITVDRPAPTAVAAVPEAPGVSPPETTTGSAVLRPAGRVSPARVPPTHDPQSSGADEPVLVLATPTVAEWAAQIRGVASIAATPTGFANAVAEAIHTELDADHVALWQRDRDEYVVVGAAGLSAGARRMRLSGQHPVVQLARTAGGLLYRGPEHHGSRAPGLPGSTSPTYAMILLDEPAVPVHVVTVSGRDLLWSTVGRVRDVSLAVGRAWPLGTDLRA